MQDYKIYPSAFQLIEYPMRRLHDSRDRYGAISLPNLMSRAVVCPITVCLSPLTMLGDIIIGIAEVSFAYYKGFNTNALKSIANKKFVASPIQHMTFIAVNATGCIAFAAYYSVIYRINFLLLLPFSGVMMISTYPYSQKIVGLLPNWAQSEGFNIFIGGGAYDENGFKYTKYFDEEYRKYKAEQEQKYQKQEYQRQDRTKGNRTEGNTYSPPPIESWDDQCTKIIKDLNLKEIKPTSEDSLTSYDQFTNGIIKKLKPRELFGLKENFKKDDLKRVYKKFSLILHPDKNRDREKEATELTKFFFSIYSKLENGHAFP